MAKHFGPIASYSEVQLLILTSLKYNWIRGSCKIKGVIL